MSDENKNLSVLDEETDKTIEKDGEKNMSDEGKKSKKVNLSLVVALVICLLVIAYMYTLRVGDQLKIDTAEKDIVKLTAELDLIKEEKTKWENDKTIVSKSIGSVRTVLAQTLIDLEEVSMNIGLVPLEPTVEEPVEEVEETIDEEVEPTALPEEVVEEKAVEGEEPVEPVEEEGTEEVQKP
ncbi:MAG: hypothetical protein GYA87_09335 [Christensenellaceae bacterium]|nr:hypothetical protein [Christensenellaceae bacterium]